MGIYESEFFESSLISSGNGKTLHPLQKPVVSLNNDTISNRKNVNWYLKGVGVKHCPIVPDEVGGLGSALIKNKRFPISLEINFIDSFVWFILCHRGVEWLYDGSLPVSTAIKSIQRYRYQCTNKTTIGLHTTTQKIS